MNANTAPQSPTTQKTSDGATAPTASSGTPQRIDDFIKRKLSEAESDVSSGMSDSATRAAQLGFANCANARYSAFLDAFRSSPLLSKTYAENYPNSLFLPWPALHLVLKTLKLWVDLPLHYLGAVPPEQLPWMEIFELDPADRPRPSEVQQILPGMSYDAALRVEFILGAGMPTGYVSSKPWEATTAGSTASSMWGYWNSALSSFFVVAPPEAFNTTEDWLSRFRKLATKTTTTHTVPPDDPLVIRFCRGGCLVVAAWGNEASELNKLTQDLNI